MSQLELWFGDQYEKEKGRFLQIKGENVLKKVVSPFQEICVVDTSAFGKVLINDGIIMLTEANEAGYHEMIAHVPFCVHPLPLDILAVGGGDGGTVREIIKHSQVNKVDVCEIDKKVIEVCREYFPGLAKSFNHHKVNIYFQDGAKFLETRENQYDTIVQLENKIKKYQENLSQGDSATADFKKTVEHYEKISHHFEIKGGSCYKA